MKRYRALKRRILLLPLLYLIIGLSGEVFCPEKGEIFPVYSWMIFRSVPTETTLYYLQLTEIDGRPVPNVLFPPQSPWPLQRRDAASKVVRHFGRAWDVGDRKAATAYRQLLEDRFFPSNQAVHYTLVRRTYRPLALWSSGRHPASEEELASFEVQK